MPNAFSKLPLAAACAVLALGFSACGSEEPVTMGLNEGSYIDVGTMAYQVQISRVLNPKSAEDQSYLEGVPAADLGLQPSEQWFAVFVGARNFGDKPEAVATRFRVVDSDGTAYEPIALDATNVFRWNPTAPVAPDFTYPDASSIPGAGPVRNGGLLLFKLSDSVYQNRPLVLEILGSGGKPVAAVDLDL